MSSTNTDHDNVNYISVGDVMVGDRITFALDDGTRHTVKVTHIAYGTTELVISDGTYGYAFQNNETVEVKD